MDNSNTNGSEYLEIQLERVLGLTVANGSSIDCDPLSGTVAYTAGSVAVLCNPRKNKQSHLIVNTKKTLTCLAFSADGNYIATGECGHPPSLRIWSVQDSEQLVDFCGHKYGINSVLFSPNGKYVVSVGSQHDMTLNVWEWQNKLKIASSKVSCKVKAMSFSVSGAYFVTVGNHHVKFWYLEYSRTAKYKPTEGMPLMGRSAILGDQRSNYFCDVGCGKGDMADSTFAITKSGLLCEFNSRRLLDKWVELKTSSANSLYVGEFTLVVGCADGVVRCFSPFDLHFLCTLPKPHSLGIDIAKGLTASKQPAAKFPDTVAVTLDELNKKVYCVYNDHSLYVWDIRDTKKVGKCQSFLYHSACIWGIEVYPDEGGILSSGTFLTCSSDDTIRIWNLEPNQNAKNVFSSELQKILYTDPDLAYLCDVHPSEDKLDTVFDGKNGVRCLKISPDGVHLASGDRSGNIRIYDLRYMEMLFKIEAHDAEVLSLEYSKNSGGKSKKYLCSASRDRLIHIFDANQEYNFVQTLDDHNSSVTAAKFVQTSGQLQLVSCGADKAVIFRKAQFIPQMKLVREQQVVGKSTLYDMEVDVNQQNVLAACQDQNIRVFCVSTARQKRCFKGSQGEDGTLIKVVLDPTGTYIATSSTDKNMYIYEYETGTCVASMSGHSELVTGLRFTNSGKHIISVSGDGCVFVWKLPLQMTQNIAKQSLLSSPSKTWQTTRKNAIAVAEPIQKQEKSEPENGYHFNVGHLPSWAKKQMAQETPTRDQEVVHNNSSHPPIPPRGRWAQRIEGQGLVVKSYLNSDSIIPFPNVQQQIPNNNSFHHSSSLDLKELSKQASSPRNRHATDSSSTASSLRLEDVEAEDERSDGDGKIRYPINPPGEDLSSSSFNVCAKTENTKPQRKIRKSRSDILKTPEPHETTSDGEDSGTPVESNFSSFSVSTENLVWLDQREKYMKRNYESLDQTKVAHRDSRRSITAKYLTPKPQGPPVPEKPQLFSSASRPSPSLKKIQAQTKKREELTKALNDAKKKLETLGWRRGLGASKSVGDLRNLPDRESIWNTSPISNDGGDIRRTSSYTDISGQRRMLPVTPQVAPEPPSGAPLWDQGKNPNHTEEPIVQRSTSMAALNKHSEFTNGDISGKPAQIVSPHTLPRSLSVSNIRKPPPPNKLSYSTGGGESSSSSSDGSPTEALPRRFNKASKESSRAKLSIYSPGGRLSHSKSEWDLKGAMRREQSGRDRSFRDYNPATVPLSKDICERIAEDLNLATARAMQVFQRVSMDPEMSPQEKSLLTTTLAQGVWQAQQNLRPAMPPMPMWAPMPGGGNSGGTEPDAMFLLQQYSDKLLSIVEQRFGNKQI